MNLKIGILVPFSNGYPTIGRDFIDGLELALKNHPYELFIESIGFGADMEQIVGSVQRLLNQNRVHILTGLLGHHLLDQLYAFIDSMQAVLLYSDLGAKIPFGLKKRPTIFCNSFDLSLSTFQTAKYMVDSGFQTVAVSTCYYDAGYSFIDALGRGLSQSGGAFAGHYVTPHMPRENEADIMKHLFEEVNPAAICAQYSGIFAREHASFLSKYTILEQYPFFASYYTVENRVLNDFPGTFDKSYCIASWMPEDTNTENQQFLTEYLATYDRLPNEFSLLGFENGNALANIISNTTKFTVPEMTGILEETALTSPRGIFHFNRDTHRTAFDQKLWDISFKDGTYSKTIKKHFDNQIDITSEWINSGETSPTGWFNAYLCQ